MKGSRRSWVEVWDVLVAEIRVGRRNSIEVIIYIRVSQAQIQEEKKRTE
jgi:hypothetical protein